MSSQTGGHKEKLEPDWEWQAQRGFQPFSSWVNFHKQKTCSSVKGRLMHACALDLWNGSSLRASASGLVPALAISSGFGLPPEMRNQPHMPPSWSLRLKEKAQMASGLEREWPLGRTDSGLWTRILRRH
ncbi:unnamed protein product [Rangifer tarandus platyrhynchus]|uniref:Uncharacterized protein n=1 Tax=Rangifer tarandus platyrhynchus TaxID=3082113 RepID=A0AC59Y458_RANTA